MTERLPLPWGGYVSHLRMPTFRGLGILLAGAIALASVGCAVEAEPDDEVAEQEDALGASPRAAGIRAGSPEEEGVLLLVNDRAVGESTLRTRTKVSATVARGIVAFRTADDGSPRWFSSIDEIDGLRLTGKTTFVRLVADARASGYVEAPGFDPPTMALLRVPDGLGRPPTSADVTVEAGFDGKPPDEVAAVVQGRLTNVVHERNEAFVERTIRATHKAFTIAVGNLFAQGSPHADFARGLGAESLTMLGTMSALRPTILVAEKDGEKRHYARGSTGRYEVIEAPRYPVIMRARVSLEPQGVRVFYPAWSATVLTEPTTVITEGGS